MVSYSFNVALGKFLGHCVRKTKSCACNNGMINVVNPTRVLCQGWCVNCALQITAGCWRNTGRASRHLCRNVTDPVVNDSPSIKREEQTRTPLADLDKKLSNTVYWMGLKSPPLITGKNTPKSTRTVLLTPAGWDSSGFLVNDHRVSGLKLHVSLFSSAQTGSRHTTLSACRWLDSCITAKTDLTTGCSCSLNIKPNFGSAACRLLERFNVRVHEPDWHI